jgi:hypothetical protein
MELADHRFDVDAALRDDEHVRLESGGAPQERLDAEDRCRLARELDWMGDAAVGREYICHVRVKAPDAGCSSFALSLTGNGAGTYASLPAT